MASSQRQCFDRQRPPCSQIGHHSLPIFLLPVPLLRFAEWPVVGVDLQSHRLIRPNCRHLSDELAGFVVVTGLLRIARFHKVCSPYWLRLTVY